MGGGSSQSQSSSPGSLSPITAVLWNLFGGNTKVAGNQFVPTGFGGGAFTPEMFSALPGLLQNQPLTGTERSLLSDTQPAAAQAGLASQGLLQAGANALPALLETNPAASIAAARRGFTQETLPSILERAPGFSSSDLQRELTKAGTDLETNISALKEANLGRVGQVVSGLPAFAQAYGTNLLDQASQALGFGQVGRELVRETSPAGDAFRVLTQLQSLLGPSLTNRQQGGSKSTNVL